MGIDPLRGATRGLGVAKEDSKAIPQPTPCHGSPGKVLGEEGGQGAAQGVARDQHLPVLGRPVRGRQHKLLEEPPPGGGGMVRGISARGRSTREDPHSRSSAENQ